MKNAPRARWKAATPEKKRVRRAPEEARALILDAAESVFREKLPDAVGLKEIARAAGVSHALVSHYFGTYEALVEAALERRVAKIREELVAAAMRGLGTSADVGSVLAEYRHALQGAVEDPVTVRLAIWALLSGRASARDFFPGQAHGLRALADVVSARQGNGVPRERVEFAIVTSFSLMVTWAVGKRALLAALGRKYSREDDEWLDAELRRMLGSYLTA